MFDLSEENVARLLMRDAQQLAGRARGTETYDSAYAPALTAWPLPNVLIMC